uniref:Coatomer subunit zeta n=1 Tax=Globodera pallida TaxID=36090 RepID=A0A183C950_GLOPA
MADLVAEDQFVEEEEAEGGALLELAEEEGSSSNGFGGTKASTGHGRGQQSMSEDEIVAAIQSAMNKASAHMEDSMIASYCSLVVAILVDSDEVIHFSLQFVPNSPINRNWQVEWGNWCQTAT